MRLQNKLSRVEKTGKYELLHEESIFSAHADNKDLHQPVQPGSLIRAFIVCLQNHRIQ